MMGVALVLAILTIAGVMSPWILLVLTFALSAGDAFETPAWRAILPEVVPKEDLAAASALNGIEFSGWAGARWHDHIGCWCRHSLRRKFRIVLRRHSRCCQVEKAWPQQEEERAAGIFFGSHRRGNSIRPALSRDPDRIAQNRRGHLLLQRTLRVAAHGFSKRESQCNRVWTLAWLLWWRWATESIVSTGVVSLGLVTLAMSRLHRLSTLAVVMLVGGAAWVIFISLINALVQNLAPDWVRARVLAIFILVYQGSYSLGTAAGRGDLTDTAGKLNGYYIQYVTSIAAKRI